ncbi:MAG TPA: IS4 family transposase, partial [Gaiellaceae bacterium]|nr:IS4 family transposase [Gaiellaceae bacterium]
MQSLDVSFAEALSFTASLTPSSLDTFARHLDQDWIEEALLNTGTATLRRRRLPAEQVVWLVIGMALVRNRPIKDVVAHLDLALPSARGERTVAPSAVTQARARVGGAPLEWLFTQTAAQWTIGSADRDRWRGLALYAVDGTTLRVPDSVANREHFGSQDAGAGRGISGYPLARLVTLMAVRSHLLLAASFGPYGSERAYAADVWPSVPDHSLVLIDRLYLQADILVPLRANGVERHWLTRAKSTSKWAVIERCGIGDELVEFTVSRAARQKDPSLPATYRARAIRYQRKGFAPQTLLTSLLDAKRYPAEELRALYHERWEIELGFGELKTDMLQREEALRSQSPAMVDQEIWGLLLAYNLVRLEMERIADEVGLPPLRISFVAALRFVVDEWGWSTSTESPGAIPRHLV